MSELISKQKLISDLKKIGIKNGELLHLKVSMRAIGKIEGGANSLIDALLQAVGEKGTIVIDAFINAYPLPFANDEAKKVVNDKTLSYAGALANAMIKHPQGKRSKHPIQKFSAIGFQAEELCNNHTDESGGYDLLHEMAKLDAKNLTIGKNVVGVGTTHVAIESMELNKRKLANNAVNYLNDKNEIKIAKIDWNGGCGRGFPKFIPLYRQQNGLINEGKIGNADSILTSMKNTLDIEIEKLKKDKKFFFCNDPACYSCRISWEHSDKKYIKFYFNWLKQNVKGLSFARFKNIYKNLFKK